MLNGAAISGPTNIRSRPRRGGIAGRGEACNPQGTENTAQPSDYAVAPHSPGLRRSRRAVEARASGFIIKADGTIVTNNHVVAAVMVTLDDSSQSSARTLGRDPDTDIAALEISTAGFRDGRAAAFVAHRCGTAQQGLSWAND